MPHHDPFIWMDATEQAALVRRRDVKPTELVDAAIGRIERLNPKLNAVISNRFEQARIEARAMDERLAQALGDEVFARQPFFGVPFLLKELSDLAGSPSTSGSRYLATVMPDADGALVRRYKESGLIVLGKTNTPEYGLLPTTEPRLFGPARNPWNLSRTPGGSSGGAAAAVAGGMVAVAHANDGGGSIRIPASCCGLFGLKPSRGRTPGDNVLGLTVEHAVTRTVRDSASLLGVIAGAGAETAFAPDSPSGLRFLDEVNRPVRPLRIAFSTRSPLGTPVHSDCVAGALRAARLCEALGHTVVERAPSFDAQKVKEMFMILWYAGCTAKIDGLAMRLGRRPAAGELEPFTEAVYEAGRGISASQLLLAKGYLDRFTAELARFFDEFDLWLTPTLAEPPMPLGTFRAATASPSDLAAVTERANAFVPIAPIANITGRPAMSVPLHQNADGLPIGIHFLGRNNDEATLIRLAAQLEAAAPWRDLHPTL